MLGLGLGGFGAREGQRNVALSPALRCRGTKILYCDGLVLGHGSAELRIFMAE